MFELRIQSYEKHIDNLHDQLTLLGAAAVTLVDSGDHPIYEPDPDETILWQETTLVAYFEDDKLLDGICNYLNTLQSQGFIKAYTQSTLANEDWVRKCLDQFTPMAFGKRLWIVPSWHAAPDKNAVNILLDPGLAFGTGTHPTTRLCLEWLDANIHQGETVMDYGCGSGILAIAALKLGAKSVVAIDHDPQALLATRMNAKQNEVNDDALLIEKPEDLRATPVDILIANILAKPIIELASRFSSLVKPQGKIVLSGIFHTQADEIQQVYQPYFNMASPVILNEWVRLEGVKR